MGVEVIGSRTTLPRRAAGEPRRRADAREAGSRGTGVPGTEAGLASRRSFGLRTAGLCFAVADGPAALRAC